MSTGLDSFQTGSKHYFSHPTSMNCMNFHSFDDLYALLFDDKVENRKATLSNLPPDYLTTCIAILQASERPENFQKLLSLMDLIEQPAQLEAMGKGLSLQQFLMLIVHFFHHPAASNKISPLLVGLSPSVFFQVLHEIAYEYLAILKQESLSEPLQHQLTLFLHDCEKIMEEKLLTLSQVCQEIELLQKEGLSYGDLKDLEDKIKQLRLTIEERVVALNKALAITWNTNRIDLIDKLSKVKEHFNYLLNQQIGHPSSNHQAATGLYSTLEETLCHTFGNPSLQGEEEVLQDEDSALEGLAKFSLWYLTDYWKLGLLPTIPDPIHLELDASQYNDQERLEHRKSLFILVQQHLNKLHIGTVGALKRARIFSKRMLEEYISCNRHLLLEKTEAGISPKSAK